MGWLDQDDGPDGKKGEGALGGLSDRGVELYRHRPDARVPGGKIRSVPRDQHHNGRRSQEKEQWRPCD